MDLKMIAVNIAVVSLVFIPYFLLIVIGQREYRKINKRFQQEVKKLNLKIDQKDRWNQNAIGIDSSQQKLVLVQRRQEEFFVQVVDLSSVKKCEIAQEIKQVQINEENQSVLEKIDLELLTSFGEGKITVNLFSSEYTFDQEFELKHAEKWKAIIDSVLSAKTMYKKVA